MFYSALLCEMYINPLIDIFDSTNDIDLDILYKYKKYAYSYSHFYNFIYNDENIPSGLDKIGRAHV